MTMFKGEKWMNRKTGQVVKIMADIDNYVMFRYKGCIPGVEYKKDFVKWYAYVADITPGPKEPDHAKE